MTTDGEGREMCYVILGPHNTIQSGSLSLQSKGHAWDTWLNALGVETDDKPRMRSQLEDEKFRPAMATIEIVKD